MTMEETSSENEHEESISAICCENNHLSFQIDNDYVKYNGHSHSIPHVGIIPQDIELVNPHISSQTQYADLGYAPPPIDRDIIVLVQSFLI